jgi:3',5'-cyclic AMP phosphodiesterase CpdA
VRIAHVSDVHLLSLENTHLLDFANKRWTGGVNLALNRGRHYQTAVFDALVDDVNALGIEEVACTGDVTNLAFESEFRFARERFGRFARGPAHVTCIPGNHDTYVASAAGAFERIFADYCSSDAGLAAGAPWPLVRVRGDLAIVGLSTSEASPWFLAYGTIGGAQLERFERALGDPRLQGKFRLVLVHHPPAGPYTRKWTRHLRDHEAFARVLARTGADLVLHGHEHRDLSAELAGPGGARIPVRGIQSGSYDPGAEALAKSGKAGAHAESHRARYRIFTVERDASGVMRLAGEELRGWRAESGRFESEGVRASVAA